MINFDNHDITAITYDDHSIQKVYGCDGNLVCESQNPQVFGGKWLATYADGHTESAECDSSSAITPILAESSATSIEIGDCVAIIGVNAFNGCRSLTSVTIPDSVTQINDGAFYNCTSLSSIVIPDSVAYILDDVFEGCENLESVTIGSGITRFGSQVFYTSITPPATKVSVTINRATPPLFNFSYKDGGAENVFISTCVEAIYVPPESVDTYKNHNRWRKVASLIQPIP